MNNAFKYFKLDMKLVKPFIKFYSIFLLIALLFILSKDQALFGINYLMLIAFILSVQPFSVQERLKCKNLYNILPTKKMDIIKGRYIYFAFWMLLINIVELVATVILININYISLEYLPLIIISNMFVVIVTAILYPVYFRYGTDVGRIIQFFIYTIPIIVVLTIPNVLFVLNTDLSLFTNIYNSIPLLTLVYLIVFIVSLSVSALISNRVYK